MLETADWEAHKACGSSKAPSRFDYEAQMLSMRMLQIDIVDHEHVSFDEASLLEKEDTLPEYLRKPCTDLTNLCEDQYLFWLECLALDLWESEEGMSGFEQVVYFAVKRKHGQQATPTPVVRKFLKDDDESKRLFQLKVSLQSLLSHRLDRKKLFQTRDGRLGLASMYIQIGDSVVLLEGCNLPMIVRPEGTKWRLIAPAWIPADGVMEGKLWKNDELQAFTFV